MTPKTIKITYWTATSIFAILTFMDGIGGVTRQQAGVDVMNHLGFPVYFLSISGIAKLLAAAAIIQTKYQTLREWAYAGIAINFIGAFAARAYAGDGGFELIFPLIMLAVMFVPYYFWKKYEEVKHLPARNTRLAVS